MLSILSSFTGTSVLRLLNTEGGVQEELWRVGGKLFAGWVLGRASLNLTTGITVRLSTSADRLY